MNEARTLLGRLGTGDTGAAIAALLAGGEKGVQSLLRALAKGAAYGAPNANGRAVVEDLEHALQCAARAHPTVVIQFAQKHPVLLESFAFVSALWCLPDADARDLLVPLLTVRDAAIRWLALEALLRQKDKRAIAHLRTALGDRDGLIVFTAATAMERWGTQDDVAKLTAIAEAARTPPGTRDAALTALRAIAARKQARPALFAR